MGEVNDENQLNQHKDHATSHANNHPEFTKATSRRDSLRRYINLK